MSRSYKKSPVWTDGRGGQKKAKRIANKQWRKRDLDYCPRAKKEYRKNYCSWEIHDYISYWTETEAYYVWKEQPTYRKQYPSFKEYFDKEYAKYFIRK